MATPIRITQDNFSVSETSTNDSDVTITLDGKRDCQVLGVWVQYDAGPTAATRQLCVEFQTSGGTTIFEQRAGDTQTANEKFVYQFGVGLADMTTAARTDGTRVFLTVPIAPVPMEKGGKVRIYDADGTGVAEDDLVITIMASWT